MERYYKDYIQKYSHKKITIISGPRQAGKTTLSKTLCSESDYLNYDSNEDRDILILKSWNRSKEQIIFDEIHKMKNWKSWLKGIFDTEAIPPKLTVTGSAKLDTFRKVGDSLAGRYFQYRLHPLDIRELYKLNNKINIEETIDKLINLSGFPEPFLEGESSFYNKWKRTHLDIILRQDLIDIEGVRDIKSIEILIDLLRKRVGSPISYVSLARDLHVSDKTIKKWLTILEDLYVIFKVIPFHRNIARANTKQPKYYFFDNARVSGDDGIKIENLVATTLFKEVEYQNDCHGRELSLYYLAKNGGREIDFALSDDEDLKIMIEVKNSDDKLSPNFKLFSKDIPDVKCVQIVRHLKREKTFLNGAEIRRLGDWLTRFIL